MPDELRNPTYGHEVYVWVVDDPEGKHGIPAAPPIPMRSDVTGETIMQAAPMWLTRRRTAEICRPVAQSVANLTGLPVKLVRMVFAEVIEEVKPR